MNILKKWRERRQQKKALKQQQQTLQLWIWLEKLFDAGQLTFDYKAHRLFITQPLASLFMSRGAGAWVQSVHNIYEYVHWLQTQQSWEEYIQREELAAVREAVRQGQNLSRADIDRIKIARCQQIAFSDMEPPKVEPFEFFIIPLSTEAKVEPIAVGYYDPNTSEMNVASWSDVQQLLKDGHQ